MHRRKQIPRNRKFFSFGFLNPFSFSQNMNFRASHQHRSHQDYSPSLPNNENKQCYRSSQPKPPRILSTAQLISAIGQICDSASRPLSVLLPKENVNHDDKGLPKEKILGSVDEKKK
ncbi:hypothetical protein E2542_SST30551 [Spatholobus suberectus]|nr:hypothetical protein E2542_SST30551 [Spatholobus suberectus]